MKGILYPVTPLGASAYFGGTKFMHTTKKNMNETGHPMEVLLYETKNAGGCGAVVGYMWIGPGYEVPKRTLDEVAAMAYCPGEKFTASHLGADKVYCYEILHVQKLAAPAPITDFVWRGSTKPPHHWRHVEL